MAGAWNLFFNAEAWGFRARSSPEIHTFWAQLFQLNSVRRLSDRPTFVSFSVLG